MSETGNTTPRATYIIPPPSTPSWKTPALIGSLLLLAASNIYLYTQLEHARTDFKNEISKMNENVAQQLGALREEGNASVLKSRKTIETLQQQLDRQRAMADREVGAAKAETQRNIASLEQKVSAEQQKQAQLLTQVKQTADTTSTKVDSVQADVGSVKSDLGSTKSELETTIANLKRVAGDVDNHGSLIATNGKELAALRALGERNYFEFTVAKAKAPQRVGDISILLKKADPKKNKYTIEVTADDQKVEKKDRGINEPVQFYTSKAKQPYEIVVNSVRKDTIVGYLSTPKVQSGR
jgi:chromosome segregation ATPase